GFELVLAGPADATQHDLPRVALNLFARESHGAQLTRPGRAGERDGSPAGSVKDERGTSRGRPSLDEAQSGGRRRDDAAYIWSGVARLADRDRCFRGNAFSRSRCLQGKRLACPQAKVSAGEGRGDRSR